MLTGEQLDHRLIVEALRAELCLRYAPAPHPRPRAERAAPSQGGLLRRLLTLVPLPTASRAQLARRLPQAVGWLLTG